MATYNGEKFIKAQILSIISQTYEDWNLIIHDDGSKDNTISIIKEWETIDKRIHFVEDGVIMGSAAKNFMHLLTYSTSEYIMFCDQDDVWFDNKVEAMLSSLKSKDFPASDGPSVLYSNSYVWIPGRGIKGLATLTFPKNINSLLFLNNGTQGCASIFNANMRNLLLKWKGDLAMHDHLLQLLGCTLGKVYYYNVPLMLYRNHGLNVTGYTRVKKNSLYSILRAINHPIVDKKHFESVKKFKHLYNALFTVECRKVLDAYLSMPNLNLIGKIITVLKYHFKCYDSSTRIIVKMFVKPYLK